MKISVVWKNRNKLSFISYMGNRLKPQTELRKYVVRRQLLRTLALHLKIADVWELVVNNILSHYAFYVLVYSLSSLKLCTNNYT